MATNKRWLILALCLSSPAAFLFGQGLLPLILVDEPRSQVRLQKIEDNHLVCQNGDGARRLELERVVRWGWWQDNSRGPQIVLHDGTVFVGDPIAIQPQQITVSTSLFGQLSIPRTLVSAIIFRPATDVIDRDRMLQDFIESTRNRESVWLFNGDRIDGAAVSKENPAGISTLQIGESIVVEIENVIAMACGKGNIENPVVRPAGLWLGFRDGTRLAVSKVPAVSKIAVTESMIELQLSGGFSISGTSPDFWNEVTWVEPKSPKLTYLSDLRDTDFKHIPFLSASWPLGIDRNVLGGVLRSDGHPYAKGLGMHSASRAAHNLAGKFRWFEADVAMDDRAGERGSVVFRVFVDAARAGQPPQWTLGYESPIVRGGSPPLPMRVDVAGAQRLALVVDFADRGDECDYANWLHCRLVP